MPSYSFSLDRQDWSGRYSTRKEAVEAAVSRALLKDIPPESVFVGQRIEPDAHAYGHARAIIQTMRRGVQEDHGDLADDFLRKPTERQIADLDNSLERTIKHWLAENDLDPSWVRVEAVGEYPMPTVISSQSANGNKSEVHDVGVSEFSGVNPIVAACKVTVISKPTPVLRYSEEPDQTSRNPGSSEYLRTGVGDS